MRFSKFEEIVTEFVSRYNNLEIPVKDAIDPLIGSLLNDLPDENTKDAIIVTMFDAMYGRDEIK